MKKLIFTLALTIGTITMVTAQIEKQVLKGNPSVKTIQLNKGVKIPNIKTISTTDLHKKNLPVISITKIEKNARPLTSWKITPMRLKDTSLEVYNFFGRGTKTEWEIHSFPMLEGREVTKWEGGYLSLRFRQSKDVTYRMKIQLKGGISRGSQLYVSTNGFAAKYPVDPNDQTVNVIWTANRSTSAAQIHIGQFVDQNAHHDQRQPYDTTRVEYVSIDKIER